MLPRLNWDSHVHIVRPEIVPRSHPCSMATAVGPPVVAGTAVGGSFRSRMGTFGAGWPARRVC